jgi:hypothetical protein
LKILQFPAVDLMPANIAWQTLSNPALQSISIDKLLRCIFRMDLIVLESLIGSAGAVSQSKLKLKQRVDNFSGN